MTPVAVSVADAARALGVSEQHVRNLVKRNEIPAIRLGSRQVIPMRWIEEQVERAIEEAS